jgi:hypothetical protein
MVDIVSLEILLVLADTDKKFQSHMEYDQLTPPVRYFDSPCLHASLNFELPSEEALLEVMDSIDKPKEYVMHRSSIILHS